MYDMRSPDGRSAFRPGRTFEDELNLRYLSPGAFTVLSPEENGSAPDPPPAPQQFRLSPHTRRNKNQSFAIIAEPRNYEPSRSPSPNSGRVSPFRGRGFNPTGSRHASPATSPPPPPEDNRIVYRQNNNNNNINNNVNNRKRSHIPQLKRRNSSVILSTEDSSDSSPKHQRRNSLIKPQLSRSLNNIGPHHHQYHNVSNKPPPAPASRRYTGVYSRNGAISRLSPIIGSSPEPSSDSKSQSSPSRIPKSRSSPSSRKPSPSRNRDPSPDKGESSAFSHPKSQTRARSRSTSRNASKNPSRDPSPSSKPPISPTKNPLKSYRNVQAKVNSFNAKSKSNVPNNSSSSSSSAATTNNVNNPTNQRSKMTSNDRSSASKLNRTDSIAGGRIKKPISNVSKPTSNTNNSTVMKQSSPEKKSIKKTASSKNVLDAKKETESDSASSTTSTASTTMHKVESAPKLTDMLPSATTVVSTTTETVTKPLKIEATLDTPLKTSGNPAPVSVKPFKETPMYMDEDSQTLLKDHNLTKLSPNATAIVSLANEPQPKVTMPQVETITTTTTTVANNGGQAIGQTANGGTSTIPVKAKEPADGRVTTNNVTKLISPDDSFGARVHYENSASLTQNEKTVLPTEVKPIKIMVQEKGDNMEVQSGNVRFPPSSTNGTAQGAGAPTHLEEVVEEEIVEHETSKCGNFMTKVKQKLACGCCKKVGDETVEDAAKQGCFSCCKRKKKTHDVEEIIISSAEEAENAKKSFFEKLKCCTCCRKNKVGDSSCCGLGGGKKNEKWTERRDSILSDPVPLTKGERCKNFFKILCCCGICGSGCCKKTPAVPKVEDAASRRASLLSKKKSLTPTVIPQEDPKNKLDQSLVEYTSTMKAAIPVLPLVLAYFCLFFNIFAPGTGTVFSGLFCLCMGKPRFSQRDGPKPRFGSFIINTIIGAGQLFTVLFCLVGWGWSIWWGVIMIKVAKKYKKIKLLEERMEAQQEKEARGSKEGSQSRRDVEKGRS